MEKGTLMDDIFRDLNKFNFSENIIGDYSPLSLAFIGDAVFEIYIRTYVLSKGNMSPHKLHIASAGFVNAKAQAKIMHEITKYLNEDEVDIARRGRNAKSATIPKNANITDYKNATGLESLFGYLYLSGKAERLCELLEISIKIIE